MASFVRCAHLFWEAVPAASVGSGQKSRGQREQSEVHLPASFCCVSPSGGARHVLRYRKRRVPHEKVGDHLESGKCHMWGGSLGSAMCLWLWSQMWVWEGNGHVSVEPSRGRKTLSPGGACDPCWPEGQTAFGVRFQPSLVLLPASPPHCPLAALFFWNVPGSLCPSLPSPTPPVPPALAL